MTTNSVANPEEYVTTMNQRLIQELSDVRKKFSELESEFKQIEEELGSRENQVTYQRGLLKSFAELREIDVSIFTFANQLENKRRIQVRALLRKNKNELLWVYSSSKISCISLVICISALLFSNWFSFFLAFLITLLPWVTITQWIIVQNESVQSMLKESDKTIEKILGEIHTNVDDKIKLERNVDFMDQLIEKS